MRHSYLTIPWQQGAYLGVEKGRQLSEVAQRALQADEERKVFALFSASDWGRSRAHIAVCTTPEQAAHIVEAHNLWLAQFAPQVVKT